MIPRTDAFVPLGAPGSPLPRIDRREALALAVARPGAPAGDLVSEAVQRTFRLALLEAMNRVRPTEAAAASPALATPGPAVATPAPETAPAVAPPAAVPWAPAPPPAAPTDAGTVPPPDTPPAWPAVDEQTVIGAAARRAGVDARFLEALRRAENGRPGREFGVLSVPAPTYEDQARVAADSVRRNVERFERTGRVAVDPVTGQYTEAFIRFFSGRWAPVGAGNDPTGLNRHHAANLIRLYARVAPTRT